MKTMAEPRTVYDEPSDTLYIDFEQCKCGTNLALSDQIVIRVDAEKRRVLGLMLQDFSVLANRSDVGPRTFPLTRLDEIAPDLRELAMGLVHSPPVADFLTISAYSPGAQEIPIIRLNTEKLIAHAA